MPLDSTNVAQETNGNLDAIKAAQTDGTQKTQVTNFPATQPISGTVDISDREARRIGRVTNPFYGAPVVVDSSGNLHTGVFVGGTFATLQTGTFTNWPTITLFDGLDRGSSAVNQGIDCGAFGVSTNFTVECKFSLRKLGVTQVILGTADDAQMNFQIFIDAANKINGRVTDGGATIQTIQSSAIALGNHDVAMSYDGSTLRLYVDGTLIGSGLAVSSLQMYNGTTHFWIGKSGATSSFPFNGGINEVRVSSSARYIGASYTIQNTQFGTDGSTTALYHMDVVDAPISSLDQDIYGSGEVLADQAGAGAALTFSFVNGPVVLLWVRADGGQARLDPFGGTPTASIGIRCDDGIPNPITIKTNKVKVFANSGTTVQVWGFRY